MSAASSVVAGLSKIGYSCMWKSIRSIQQPYKKPTSSEKDFLFET